MPTPKLSLKNNDTEETTTETKEKRDSKPKEKSVDEIRASFDRNLKRYTEAKKKADVFFTKLQERRTELSTRGVTVQLPS